MNLEHSTSLGVIMSKLITLLGDIIVIIKNYDNVVKFIEH